MTRRQSSPQYEQAPNTEPAVRQSAACPRCGSMLEFPLNGMGVVLEICPHCHEGKPLRRSLVIPVHRCEGCGTVMSRETYGADEALCRRCRPRFRIWNKCADCNANCRQTRCGPCRVAFQRLQQRKAELERRGRMDFYHRRQGNG